MAEGLFTYRTFRFWFSPRFFQSPQGFSHDGSQILTVCGRPLSRKYQSRLWLFWLYRFSWLTVVLSPVLSMISALRWGQATSPSLVRSGQDHFPCTRLLPVPSFRIKTFRFVSWTVRYFTPKQYASLSFALSSQVVIYKYLAGGTALQCGGSILLYHTHVQYLSACCRFVDLLKFIPLPVCFFTRDRNWAGAAVYVSKQDIVQRQGLIFGTIFI